MSKHDIEGLVLLLDVGESMSTKINQTTTYLQSCVDIIQMIIQRKMFQSSKDEIALILFGTAETDNELWDGTDDYRHVTVARSLAIADWEILDYVQNKISVSNINGDVLDAVLVATNHFKEDQNKKKIFKEKRIIVLTDFSSSSNDSDKFKKLRKNLTNDSIRLDVISPFSDDNGDSASGDQAQTSKSNDDRTQKPMTGFQQKTCELLKGLCEQSEGALFSFDETLTLLSTYQSKSIKSTGTKYQMKIGEKFTIPVVSMIKCKENKPEIFRFKKVFAKDESVELKSDRARFTKDDEQRDLDDKTDVVDAYKYGSTYVPIDSDSVSLKLQVEKCFGILGFTKSENVKRYYFLGDSVHQILPDVAAGDEYEEVFCNMVRAMYNEDVYGLVRKVFSCRSSPELGCLIPYITRETTCLFYLPLPFDDDMKKISLENFTVMKKFKPNEKQLDLIDDLIDSMDLSKKKDDDDEEPYDPHLTFNPYIQRMFQSIALRGTNPSAELPDFENHLTNTHLAKIGAKYRNEITESILKRCCDEFPIKEIVKKVKKGQENIFDKGKKDENQDDVNMEVNDDENLDEILNSNPNNNKIKKVGTVNPVEDFRILSERFLLLNTTDSRDEFEQICVQIQIIIKDLFDESLQQVNSTTDMDDISMFTFQEKSFSCIKILREYSVKFKFHEEFNSFLKTFKIFLVQEMKKSKLSKYVENFWSKFFVESNLGLITDKECENSNINSEKAEEFLGSLIQNSTSVTNKYDELKDKEDVEDLLDLM